MIPVSFHLYKLAINLPKLCNSLNNVIQMQYVWGFFLFLPPTNEGKSFVFVGLYHKAHDFRVKLQELALTVLQNKEKIRMVKLMQNREMGQKAETEEHFFHH